MFVSGAGPWTYLTLVVDCPWLVILQELSLGVFYGILMTFLHFLTHLYLEVSEQRVEVGSWLLGEVKN